MSSWSTLVIAVVLLISAAAAAPSPYKEVDVFTIGEGGYFCLKIPYLFRTQAGTLLAFAEARYNSCSDFTATDLVYKRSDDNGTTWSPLMLFYGNTSLQHNVSNVIGNAAPVQIRSTGRIVVPFCRNNLEVLQLTSDDDGLTWSAAQSVPGGTMSGWRWVAAGPPGAIQLRSGRLVVPAYHSFWPHWTDGTVTRVHLLVNDDPNADPTKWRIAAIAPGVEWTNECQAVELSTDNHILIAARGFLTRRLQIESHDGGETLLEPYYIGITEPLDGCEGSIVRQESTGRLLYSGTVNTSPARYNMTLWTSDDEGRSWQLHTVINTGKTGYSSLQMMIDDVHVGLLYERSNSSEFLFLPTQISFLTVYPDPAPAAAGAAVDALH